MFRIRVYFEQLIHGEKAIKSRVSKSVTYEYEESELQLSQQTSMGWSAEK
jgi:hypothetical protein